MPLPKIFIPDTILCGVKLESKKRALEEVSILLSQSIAESSDKDILQFLLERERLGSTALGHGIAIPHARIPDTDVPIGAILQLAEPVDFNAPDQIHVNLIFALLVPKEASQEHLDILATLAKNLSQEHIREQLNLAKTPETIVNIIQEF